MKLGQEVWIHGYIDEMRKDIAIIKNEGGYFGAVYGEIVEAVVKKMQKQKTGHWIKTGYIDKVTCDVCHKRMWDTFSDGVYDFEYCPNCGARMEVLEDKHD